MTNNTEHETNMTAIDVVATPLDAPTQTETPVRRVGIFTLGICLILSGIFLLLVLFFPGINFTFVAKLAPLIFILMGVEVLLGYSRSKGGKVKFDFFSGFICLMLSCLCIAMSFIPLVLEYWGPERTIAEQNASAVIYETAYETLQGAPITALVVNVELSPRKTYPENFSIADLTSQDYIHFYIDLYGNFETAEDFAIAVKSVLDKVEDLRIPAPSIRFAYADDARSFSLNIYDDFTADLPVEELTKQVEVTTYTYDEYDTYDDIDEYPEDSVIEEIEEASFEDSTAA